MAQLYNPAQPHTGIGLTAAVASNQSHKPAILAASDVGLLRRALSPERRLSGPQHSHGEVHRRSMSGQLERGIGLLRVDPVTAQDMSLRPDQRHAVRDTESSGGAVSALTFLDEVNMGQGDIGSLVDRRRDARLYGRGHLPEPLRVDVDSPVQTLSVTAGSNQSRQLAHESAQVKPVSIDIRTASRQDSQDTTMPDDSCAFVACQHSPLAGGDCVRPHTESGSFVVGVRSGVHRGGPKPAVLPSVPVAIKTGTKEGKETKDSKTAGSKK